jgi:uncharacterized protein YggE
MRFPIVAALALAACRTPAQPQQPPVPAPVPAPLPAAAPAPDQAPSRESVPLITAAGEGEQRVAPDMVTIMVAVQTRHRSAVNAGGRNAEQMAAVMKALRGIGLEEAEISTAGYSLHQETWRTPNDTVYVASNTVRVETKKLNLVSRIIDTSMTAGANNVSSLQFGLSDTQPAERVALGEAVRNARARAEAMAAAAGGQLGPLEELTSQPEVVRPYMQETMAMARAAADVATPISPQDLTIRARVVARWRFVPGR